MWVRAFFFLAAGNKSWFTFTFSNSTCCFMDKYNNSHFTLWKMVSCFISALFERWNLVLSQHFIKDGILFYLSTLWKMESCFISAL
jgi:hypothetical protein